MRRIALVLVALSLLCTAPLGQGCGAALPLIHTIATVVADVTGALDAVEAQVHSRPDADPALVAKALDALGKARKALTVVQAAARVTDSAASKDYAAAVDALLAAYAAVTDLAKDFGVLQAPLRQRARMGAPSGVALVPTTDELRNGLMARAYVAVRNVAPGLAVRDGAYGHRLHPKPPSDGAHRNARGGLGPDVQNVSVREFRGPSLYTAGCAAAALHAHVAHVVRVGAEEQMRRVTARRVVAAVQDMQRAGVSVREFPRDPMGARVPRSTGCTDRSRDVKLTVLTVRFLFGARSSPAPRPARTELRAMRGYGAVFVDLAPEPCERLFVHGNLTFPVGHGPGCLRSAGPLQSKALIAAVQPLTGAALS